MPQAILLLSLLFVLVAQFNHVMVSPVVDSVFASHDPVPDGNDHTPVPNQPEFLKLAFFHPDYIHHTSIALSLDSHTVLPGSRAPPFLTI